MSRQSRKLAAQRLQETIEHVWTCYRQDPDNIELRNRLAEHYTPVVQEIARKWIAHYKLRDVDGAMGDALLRLVAEIIPHYDGSSTFPCWASRGVRQMMLHRRRSEVCRRKNFRANFGPEDVWSELEMLYVRPDEPGAESRFTDLVARASARGSALLWLQHCRGLSDKQIATAMNLTNTQVRCERRRALELLRSLTDDALPCGGKPRAPEGKRAAAAKTQCVGWDQRAGHPRSGSRAPAHHERRSV